MNDESAKVLAEAMNRLAEAIEKIKAPWGGGIEVRHIGLPQFAEPEKRRFYPNQTLGF